MQNETRKNLTILIVGETSRAENFSSAATRVKLTRGWRKITWSIS